MILLTAMSSPDAGRVRPAFETAVLLAGVGALMLPADWSGVALAVLVVLWVAARPPRQERLFVTVALGLAAALILASTLAYQLEEPLESDWSAEVAGGFNALWQELANAAEKASASIESAPERGGDHLAEFEWLESLVSEDPATTFLLLAPDSEIVAWAGEGLLHEARSAEFPRSGFAYRRGYTASTIFAVSPVAGVPSKGNTGSLEPRPWRIVAGRSLQADRLPFSTFAVSRPAPRWAFGDRATPAAGGVLKLSLAPLREDENSGAMPALFVTRPEELEGRSRRFAEASYRLGIALLGLTLLALALLRSTGGRLLPEGFHRRHPSLVLPEGDVPLLALAGTVALGTAARFQSPLTAALAAAVGLASWGLVRRRPARVRPGGGLFAGGLTAVLLVVAASLYQRWTGVEDLASSFSSTADSFALCLVWCLSALGLLALTTARRGAASGDAAAWWATALLVAGGAACDFPPVAVPLLVMAGAAAGRWLIGVDLSRRPAALAGLLALSALLGSVSWEIAYREVFKRQLGDHFLPLIAPPTREERSDLLQEIHNHFENRDVSALLTPVEGPMDPQDLAFKLWNGSPLPRRDALSAVVVETADGQRSSFSFGLSLDDNLEFVLPADRWGVPPVPEWNRSVINRQTELRLSGRVWGIVSYWFLPRPGFRLDVNEMGELEEALLRGGSHAKALDGLPRGVLYGLYRRDGRAVTSPWGEAPPLDLSLLDADPEATSIDTPDGRCWVWWRAAADGIEVLYLPWLTPRAGLERIGVHALGSLGWITAIALLALVFALPRLAIRNLFERTVRSYSKRMIMVYAVLLLLPLITLNLVLLRSVGDRERRAQRANAESALDSARFFLLDYLRGLPFGFDLKTQVDRALMEWISSVVEYPVNLYWRSRVLASSQQELFTAGLLPRRIPGEVFSRLALRGSRMGFRRHRGDVDYLELYAPLELGGKIIPGLFLSVPLLEQQEEVARELEALRRRAVLVTSALMMLLFAVGSRLARSFTDPLMDLVEGTRRIAAGAPSLEVAPREHELEALADAIDDMARRIAEGRRKLVLEKQVVERMVENIRSGVLSLDHGRKVLLQNRVAADLLGTEIGVTIEHRLEHEPRLLRVADFLKSTGEKLARATFKLDDEDGEAREWTLTWVPIPGAEDPAALLVVDDATEMLRAQRLEAWAEMARIIAHEIKNPLTPIRLSADHMRQVYRADRERFDEVFERCTSNILKQVEELADIASDFSIYSRIPRAEMVEDDLAGALEELLDGYRIGEAGGVRISFACDLEELRARFDPKLLKRAVRNVLENALRASEGRGEVELSLAADAETARIRVVDSGPGVDADHLRRIFEPYFSTYDSGTGLGLAITRRIVEEHGGDIEASNRAGGGLEIAITIPLV